MMRIPFKVKQNSPLKYSQKGELSLVNCSLFCLYIFHKHSCIADSEQTQKRS